MKRLLWFLAVCCSLLMLWGCSDSPGITDSADQQAIVLVERPQFIETRPQAEVEKVTLVASEDFLRSLEKKPPKPDPGGNEDPNPNPPHKYAYVVGISDYEGTANDLQFADDDGRDMATMFRSQGFTVVSDIDRSATADNIVTGLQWLASVAQPGDEIAFSYSGHGMKAPGAGSSIISTDLYYITHSYVMQIINSANCSKVLVTLDACVIGGFLGDGEVGSFIATASNNTNSYDAPTLGNGAWTYYFLEAANGSYVYAEDIAVYAEDGMAAWAAIYHLRVSPSHTDKYTGMFDI
ncbi:MAG: caspase family protein [candidate division Zixibacteria bacterium]|nr:caspase family protein [candidate division Zixibacteria bacterium]